MFFGQHNFHYGVLVSHRGNNIWFHATLRILIADEVALKQSIENKGAAGKLFCCRCCNVVSKGSWTPSLADKGFVHGTTTDFSQFRLHTNESVQRIVSHLAEQHEILSTVEFSKLETALGFNWRPGGILMNPQYGHMVPEIIMYDWFHIFVVHGIANRELGLFAGVLRRVGINEERVDNFIGQFILPRQFQGATPKNIFGKRDYKETPINCSASELISAYPILRTFIVHFVWDQHPSVKSQCASALRLMDCLDKLMLLNRGGSVEASELHETIKKYLDQFLQTYDAEEHWMPKHHCALHLAEFLKRHKCLLSCWVHERKHRLVKRFGNNVLNFTQGFEKSILQDIIHVQLRELETESFELGTCLINEKKAKDSQIGWLREFTGPGDVFISWIASTRAGRLHKTDVVELGDKQLGQIMFHIRAGASVLTALTPWRHIHGQMYRVHDDPVVVQTARVKTLCMYSLKDGDAMVIRG